MVLSRKAIALLSTGSLVTALLAACSGNNTTPNAVGTPSVGPTACRAPQQGCACASEGQTVECAHKVPTKAGGLVCQTGRRACTNGVWGGCDTGPLSTASAGQVFASVGPLALGGSTSCADPCDPSCSNYVDTATGLDAGSGFSVTDGGVTLAAAATCNTVIKGQIYDPGDNLPLPNVYVFLQEGPLSPLAEGVAKDSCSTILTGGSGGGVPDNRVQSGLDGSFTLSIPPGYPNTTPFNIVVQTGRWRKVIPLTANCMTQNLGHVRLPRNKAEGNIPQMAVVTGDADTLECFIAKIGVDVAEFTHPSQNGRVHMYQGCLANNSGECGPQLAGGAPHFGPVPEKRAGLLNSQAEIDKHAMLILPCEGGKKSNNASFYPNNAEVDRTKVFADKGGRIFATHLSDWVVWHEGDGGGARNIYPNTAVYKTDPFDNMFNNSGSGVGSQEANVNTAPPRAQAFYDWLAANGGLNGSNRVYFEEGRRRSLSILPNGNTWMTNHNPFGFAFYNYIHHVTFDTPVGSANPEGRIVYLSSHVAPVDYRRNTGGLTFPSECKLGNALTASEKALEYMFFDVSACVGAPPPAPAPLYSAATFVRDFVASCPVGTRVRWRQFMADLDTPSDSSVLFRAQTADSVALVGAATSYNVHLAQGATPDTPMGGVMIDANTPPNVIPPRTSRSVLRISADFTPATGGLLTPALYTWTQRYECEASE